MESGSIAMLCVGSVKAALWSCFSFAGRKVVALFKRVSFFSPVSSTI